MAHLGITALEYRNTPKEWLGVTSHLSTLVRDWSDRNDLFTMLAPVKLPGGVVAHYIPKLAEVHISIEQAFGDVDPSLIPDLTVRMNQFDYAAPLGAAYHEAMHARYSTLDFDYAREHTTEEVLNAIMILEESRIEKRGVKLKPKMRPFLRKFVKTLIMGELDPEMLMRMTMSAQAAHTCAIVLARVDAGVLKEKDVKETRAIVEMTLGTETLDKFRELWLEFQDIDDMTADFDKMIVIGEKWVELTKEASKSDPEPEEGEGDESGPGELSDKQMELLKEFFKQLVEAMDHDTDNVQMDSNAEIGDAESEARAEEKMAERQKMQEEQGEHEQVSKRVFEHPEPETLASSSKVTSTRDPLPEERAAAVIVGRQWDKAKYRDRVKTMGTTKAPPGRLRMRAVMAGAAGKAKGVPVDVEPWRRITRHQVEDPNLTVGIMTDISGSMSSAMQPMGTAAWVMSEAIRRIQGHAAMVYYGARVKPALKPGEHLEKVAVHSARDGSEDFDNGFKALDGALNLLHGHGARLLVIVSDGNYTSGQIPKCARWLARCRQAGVAVLWIGYGYSQSAEEFCADAGAQFVKPSGNITDDALLIGRAGERALSQIGSRAL